MSIPTSEKAWIVVLTTFPPRACGIATFSNDLCNAFDQLFAPELETKIVAMSNKHSTSLVYSEKVIGQILQSRRGDYVALAQRLNQDTRVKLVCIQHEFGLYNGLYGDYLLTFIAALRKPLVITFHTVLPTPDRYLLRTVRALAAHADRVVVMTHVSRIILETSYTIAPEKIVVIPHGIHPVSFEQSHTAKQQLALDPEKIMLSTFGLLSRSKGIEHVLAALPAVIKHYPHVHYHILGATHPVVLQEEGESYRKLLTDKVSALELTQHVTFHNQFLATKDLLTFLNATDIYLATPLNPNQAVSGTLSYALGAGRPVIATAFAQAREVITPEVGLLVDFQKPEEITEALLELLRDKKKLFLLGKTAYFRTRSTTWPNIAIAYMSTFKHLVPQLNEYEKHPPVIKMDHLLKMTDDFGMIQFAQLAEPDINSGYTIDDNARALILAVRYYHYHKVPASLATISIYLNFLQFVHKTDGKFENYVNQTRTLSDQQNNDENLDDANGRALYALAVTATSVDMSSKIHEQAQLLYQQSFHTADDFTSPRAKAFLIKSLALQIKLLPNAIYSEQLQINCDFLVALFRSHSSTSWLWFEPIMTYSNALLAEALLIGYDITQNQTYYDIGKQALDFLISHTFENDMYIPIGQQGWFQRGGKRHKFDQQPEDTACMIEALKTMYKVSKHDHYQALAKHAFRWFLGENFLGQVIYDQVTGGCYDGLGEHEVNLNEGAESTLSYLSSRLLIN